MFGNETKVQKRNFKVVEHLANIWHIWQMEGGEGAYRGDADPDDSDGELGTQQKALNTDMVRALILPPLPLAPFSQA